MNGLLLCDKPRGPTSFDVVARIRRRLGVRRVGHGGTLDPLATGLLPVLVGEATRLAPWLLGLDKTYLATVRFGAATDTYDAAGRITVESDPALLAALDEASVRAALARFLGPIRQRPPAYSAIKRDGRPLHERARAGEDVIVDERDVRIDAIDLTRFARPDVDLTIRCGSGTYVRSLAHDLGAWLGVPAHLAALRRTRVGPFDVAGAFDPFTDEPIPALVPTAQALPHVPAITLDEPSLLAVRRGQQAILDALPLTDAPAHRLLDAQGHLVAITESVDRRHTIARGFPP